MAPGRNLQCRLLYRRYTEMVTANFSINWIRTTASFRKKRPAITRRIVVIFKKTRHERHRWTDCHYICLLFSGFPNVSHIREVFCQQLWNFSKAWVDWLPYICLLWFLKCLQVFFFCQQLWNFGCIANFDMTILLMGFISLVDDIKFYAN